MKTHFIIFMLLMTIQLILAQTSDSLSLEKKEIINNLKKIEDMYLVKLDFDERRNAIMLLNDIINRIHKLDDSMIIKDETSQTLIKKKSMLLSDEGFEILYEQVDHEMTGERKTKIIQTIG